ncbi:MAG: ABC transporter substrate-binding protein [Deltaproteobacteria bacterium]|jgi:ABC-type nitrate/sulfonate/bicarbonate transport system substrate-binding protein|nr:ABC transporter substrate-binding protein [Deltaproteobacteria bacterium]
MKDKIFKKTFLVTLPLALIALGWAFGCGDNKTETSAQNAPAPPKVAAAAKPDQAQPAAQATPAAQVPPLAQAANSSVPEPEIVVLKVPWPNEPTSPSNILLAKELGFLKKNYLDFEYVGVVPSPQYVAALVGGKIDVSPGAHINRTIAGISAGARVKAVVANTETTQRIPHMVALVTKTSQVRKPADLVGKKIGIPTIGGCNEYTPYAWLKKNGIDDPKTKVEMIVLPEKNLEQVLRQGEIDVAMMHKVPEDVIKKGEFDIIFSDYEVWGNDGGATPPYFTVQFINERPEVVRRFVTAMADTINWSNANMREAINVTARLTNQDPKNLSERYYSPNGLIKPIHAQVWIDLLTEFGEIKPGLTVDQVFTNEFNPYYKPAS